MCNVHFFSVLVADTFPSSHVLTFEWKLGFIDGGSGGGDGYDDVDGVVPTTCSD